MSDSESGPTSLADVSLKQPFVGTVKKIDLAGALVDIGLEQDALLHISQIRRKHVNNVHDHLKEGQQINVWVKEVDLDRQRVALTMIEPPKLDWSEIKPGARYTGSVIKLEKFGVFVDIGAERPGLVHISELSNNFVKNAEDVVKKGDEVEVRILSVDANKRQIDLSMKDSPDPVTDLRAADEPEEELPTAMALAMQRALAASEGVKDESGQARGSKRQQEADRADIYRRTIENHGSS